MFPLLALPTLYFVPDSPAAKTSQLSLKRQFQLLYRIPFYGGSLRRTLHQALEQQ